MYEKILVPLDGSTLAETVLPQVAEWARRFDSEVILLRAAWSHTVLGFDEAEAQLRAVREAEEYVAAVARRFRVGLSRGTVGTAVWYADPVSAILEHATWHGVDLIAMSSHGRGGLGRLFAGSVAVKVIEAARMPVLVHRPGRIEGDRAGAGPCGRVIVPLDGSELAETILPSVVPVARAMAAEVILFRAVPLRGQTGGIAGDAGQYLEEVRRHLAVQDVVCRSIVGAGSPAEQIVGVAAQHGADLIAMATHGRSRVDRLIRGSVADAVLRAAPMPVLLTRSTVVTIGQEILRQHA